MKKVLSLMAVVMIVGQVFAQKEIDKQLPAFQLKSNFIIGQSTLQTPVMRGTKAALNESFNTFPPASWSVDPATGFWEGSGTWQYSSSASNWGDGVFAVMDCFNIADGGEGSLITPVLHPVAGDNTLSYDVIEMLMNASYIGSGMQLFIEFSTDGGTTWTTSTTNVLTGITGYNTASSPQTATTLTADLSAYNSGSVQVRFRCISDYGGFSMFLDNVTGPQADITLLTNELDLNSSYLDASGLGYYAIIPIPQFVGVTLNGSVSNLGSADQTNVIFNATDVTNSLNLSSTPQGVISSATDTLAINLTAPTTATNYSFATTVTQNETDENPANNIGDTIVFNADPALYFRATSLNSLLTSYSFGTSVPATTGMEYGGNYHFMADATIDSISVLIYGANGTGTVVGKIYNLDGATGTRTLLGQTAPYTPTGSPELKNINLTSPIDVTAGQLVTATVQLNIDVSANDTIKIGSDAQFPGDAAVGGAAYLQVSGTWGWYSVTGTVPIVGIILAVGTDVETVSNANNINIYPNPTTGILNITNAENANVVLYNMMGEVVYSVNNITRTIDVSDLAKGTYVVKVITKDNVITQKVNLIK